MLPPEYNDCADTLRQTDILLPPPEVPRSSAADGSLSAVSPIPFEPQKTSPFAYTLFHVYAKEGCFIHLYVFIKRLLPDTLLLLHD